MMTAAALCPAAAVLQVRFQKQFMFQSESRKPVSDTESSSAGRGESLKSRLREELRNYLIVSAYLFICFGALLFYKAALLDHAGVHYLPLSVAVVKALIIGKFLLIGDAVRVRLQRPPGRVLG